MRNAIVIPVYNEGSKLIELVTSLLKKHSAEDIVVVDDGSTDGCCDNVEVLGVNLLRHRINMGKGKALETGFGFCLERDYEWILTMDGDGQHPVESVDLFFNLSADSEYGIIIGNRRKNLYKMPLDRQFSNLTTSLILTLLSGKKIYDAQCGFRCYKADFLRKVKLSTSGFDTENELLLKAFRLRVALGWIDIPAIYDDECSHIKRFNDTINFIKLLFRYIFRKDF